MIDFTKYFEEQAEYKVTSWRIMKASRWADAETKFTDRELAAIRSLERPHQVVTMNETEIPLQARYETDKPYVPSDLADIPCSKLGADRLLDCLNDVLKSSYTIHTHRVSETLQVFIDSGYDFGTAYGYSRHHSNLTNGSLSSKSFLHYKEHNAQSSRERFLSEDDYHIRLPFAPPRRIWDMHSNRVLPLWVSLHWIFPLFADSLGNRLCKQNLPPSSICGKFGNTHTQYRTAGWMKDCATR